MNIIVLIKPVSEKYVNNNSANEENLVINPYDLYALSNIVELKNKNKDMSGAMISGELPLVEKKYRPAFVKDASEKIIDSTLKNVNTLFHSIRKQFDL